MNRDEAIKMLRRGEDGVSEWNDYRNKGNKVPDLNGADLVGADLSGVELRGANLSAANLSAANLSGADMSRAEMTQADLGEADMSGAELSGAKLRQANLRGTNLNGANLSVAKLSGANLSGANLCEADLSRTNLSRAKLSRANLRRAKLSRANLNEADLNGADLSGANLSVANLSGANLTRANLSLAKLSEANMSAAALVGAGLSGADLSRADLSRTDLSRANLSEANLSESNLNEANLNEANLRGATLDEIRIGFTKFTDLDLSNVPGLENVVHSGPSSVGIDTLYKSYGKIPEVFLRGCGVPEELIKYLPSLIASTSPVDFYSCFISYTHADKSFARRLHDQLQGRGIRCWLDEKALVPGDDIYHGVDQGIRVYDKVLLCASKTSLDSWWVRREIETAIEREQRLYKDRKKQVLSIIPLNLDGSLFEWDGSHAATLRKRLAADFTDWESNNKKFEEQFEQVVKALRADDLARPEPPEPKL